MINGDREVIRAWFSERKETGKTPMPPVAYVDGKPADKERFREWFSLWFEQGERVELVFDIPKELSGRCGEARLRAFGYYEMDL